MPIDYSRWKDIEISDDEDDTHPNVDTPSLFRWRHEARLQRMEEKRKCEQEVMKNLTAFSQRKENIRTELASSNLNEEKRRQLEEELAGLEQQEEDWRRKEDELKKLEELQPWNVDTISQEGFSTTRINKAPPAQPEKVMSDDEVGDFYKENVEIARKFGMLRKWKDSKEFLLEHPQLCCHEAANLLTLQCLNYELEGKSELMSHVAYQTILINYLLELAKYVKANPKSPQLISSFFNKLQLTEQTSQHMFDDEWNALKERIKNRAKEKLAEAVKEVEEEEKRNRLGPGGLDPVEVYDSLPPEMQECFRSRSKTMLKEVAEKMSDKEFSTHLQRCIDSGLWIPNANDDEELQGEPAGRGGADKAPDSQQN
uniref:Hsp90 chaperone protein kinase-targeting subunit n=1 Tax=Trichuris muris TaxID=70415 RepID=A0A5S6QCX5_TRIMR